LGNFQHLHCPKKKGALQAREKKRLATGVIRKARAISFAKRVEYAPVGKEK